MGDWDTPPINVKTAGPEVYEGGCADALRAVWRGSFRRRVRQGNAAVVAAHARRHRAEPKAGGEIYAVLRPGGRLVCVVGVQPGLAQYLKCPGLRWRVSYKTVDGDGRPISIYTFTKPMEDEQPVEKKVVHKPVQKAPSMMLKVGLKQPPPVDEVNAVNAAARGMGFKVPASSAVQRRADAGRSSPQRARPLDLSPGRQRASRAASFKLGSSFKRLTETSPRNHAAAPLSAVALARARKIMSGSPVPEDTATAQRSRPSAFDHFAYATDQPRPLLSSSSESDDDEYESEDDEEEEEEEEEGGADGAVGVAVSSGGLPKAGVSSDGSSVSSGVSSSDEQE